MRQVCMLVTLKIFNKNSITNYSCFYNKKNSKLKNLTLEVA